MKLMSLLALASRWPTDKNIGNRIRMIDITVSRSGLQVGVRVAAKND